MSIKQQRGQFFTTNPAVHQVMAALLSTRSGRALEPSAGAGDLVAVLERFPGLAIDAVELDPGFTAVCTTPITHDDFFVFAHGLDSTYDVVFGNPPYVAWKALEPATKASAAATKAPYSDKTNLYHLFIDRSVDLLAPGGEMVFIVPKEWLYTTSAQPLRTKLLASGALTHLVDCGEEKLFDDADVPALLIFRYVKAAPAGPVAFAASLTDAQNGVWQSRTLTSSAGRLLLLPASLASQTASWGPLCDAFRVRVGHVTGADGVFRLPADAHVEPSCVQPYLTTKGIEQFVDVNHIDAWSSMPPQAAAYLSAHKATLLRRRIASFDETNWWKYGAIRNQPAMDSAAARFYALAKTRSATPFFEQPSARLFGGGVLGLFQTPAAPVSCRTAVAVLNHPAYRPVFEGMFLTTGNKVSFQPATLEDAPFPRSESAARAWLASVSR